MMKVTQEGWDLVPGRWNFTDPWCSREQDSCGWTHTPQKQLLATGREISSKRECRHWTAWRGLSIGGLRGHELPTLRPRRAKKAWVLCCLVTKSCATLCDPVDCSRPGSSVHGSSQASILVWIAISFSRGSSPPRD